MENKKEDTWCVLPWIHLCVRPDNVLKPCCRYLSQSPTNELGVNLHDIEQIGVDAMNVDKYKDIRRKMLAGERLPGCQKCYTQEEHSDLTDRRSMRKFLNYRYSHVDRSTLTEEFDALRYIEMSIDNICNLQCKMCSSMFSSKLINRDKFLGNVVHKKLEPNFLKLDKMDISRLEYVKILGGEPFITPNFVKFLDYLADRSNPENITLEIITNGTSLPSQEVVDRLNRFKMNFINVSLDSYSRSNDYQRWGGSYETTFNNAREYGKIFDRVYISFHSVVSILNSNDLAKTIAFIRDENNYHISVDFVREPEHLSMLYAPREYIEWALDKNRDNFTAYRLIETFTKKAEFNQAYWSEFLTNLDKLDSYYGTRLEDYNPELAEFLLANKYRNNPGAGR